jgi:CBS domain containing-hemolysin-like protein
MALVSAHSTRFSLFAAIVFSALFSILAAGFLRGTLPAFLIVTGLHVGLLGFVVARSLGLIRSRFLLRSIAQPMQVFDVAVEEND